MPAAINWTNLDDLLRRLRYERADWDAISRRLGLPVSTCMDRARAINARPPPPAFAGLKEDVSDSRQTLPPGHPTTWGLLTRGTILEGTPYE